jgi:hypothetical protein
MAELWHIAIAGPNVLPSMLLAVICLYWISVIAGAVDLDFLNLDFDVSPDTDVDVGDAGGDIGGGPFHAALIFFNLADIPLMLFLSIWVLLTWLGTVSCTYLAGGNPPTVIALGIISANVVITLFATKFITAPLKGLLKKSKDLSTRKTVGEICRLLGDLSPDRLGQGEVKTEGAPLIINVKTRSGCSMSKGQTALVIEKDKEKNFYIVEPFNDWEA